MTTAIAKRSPEGTLPSRRRLTYEEVIDYIARDPDKIKYPNRQAKFLRNSFELSFLDTLNFEQLQEQQLRAQKYQVAKQAIQEAAVNRGTSEAAEALQVAIHTPPNITSAQRSNYGLANLLVAGTSRVATAAARSAYHLGKEMVMAPFSSNSEEGYADYSALYGPPRPSSASSEPSFLDRMFPSLDDHLAQQEAVRQSLREGASSSTSWDGTPDPPVEPPGDPNYTPVQWWDQRIVQQAGTYGKAQSGKHAAHGKRAMEDAQHDEESLLPFLPGASLAARTASFFTVQ